MRLFPFVLVQGDNDYVTQILWEFSLLTAADEEFVEFDIERWSSVFANLWANLWWDAINFCSFSTLQLFYGFRHLLQCWGLVQFCFHWLLWDAVDRGLLNYAGFLGLVESPVVTGVGAMLSSFCKVGWIHSDYFEACVEECCMQDGRLIGYIYMYISKTQHRPTHGTLWRVASDTFCFRLCSIDIGKLVAWNLSVSSPCSGNFIKRALQFTLFIAHL